MATSEPATSASATSTSSSVKPASPDAVLVDRDNFDASCQPVDTHLVADAVARQRDHSAARHPGCEVPDGRAGRPVVAAGGEHGVDVDVGWHAHGAYDNAGAHNAARRVVS